MEIIHSLDEFRSALAENKAVLAYFSTDACSVCTVLKPKVAHLIVENFPQIKTFYIQSDHQPELAAQNRIFTAPTVLIFFEGRETIRKSRVFSIEDLKREIQRPYFLLFE
ncbi:MAG: thioredoxin family protein [Verrucomicrobia bacterium]|nr:thioredoxin family protein [Prolixibacteraceae bacterium]